MEASTALLEAPIPECVHAFSSQVVASPISQNPSFSIEHPASWKPCARQHYGDCCQKIFRLDSYHVLLCGRRLVFMEGNDHFSFPPFDADILDVYAERISVNTLFIVVGLSTGVHLAVVDLREFKVDQTSFQPTASPVVKMYRVKKHLFALCLSNCQVDLMEFAAGIDFIDAMITSKWNGWTNFASKLFNPQLYKDSFFCRRNGYLVVLSTHAISIWMVGTDGKLTLTCSCSVDRNTVAVQRFHLSNLIGFAILRCGGLIPIKLFIGNDTPTLSLGEPAFIPTLTSVAEVSMSCGHNNSIVMYDAGTSSVVIVSECSPMVDDFTAGTLIASQIYLNTQVSGLCFEGTSLGGKFWVYGDESVALCLRQNSTGEIIRQSFEYNISETRRHFIEVLPCKRVELLLEVMTCGFPIKEASSLAYGLFVPEKLTSRSFRLSAGAIGVIFYFLKQIEHLDELCVSFHYWELPKHLFRACDTLRQAIDIASSFLNHGGFLDCPEELSLLWSSDFVAESVGASIADPSCVSGQAIMLQRMLGLARHAATIGWLYGLVLLEGPDHEPSRCLLKKQLADEAFSVTEEVLCTELLSLRSAEVLETMSSHCEDLPPRSRLELQLSKLALAGHGEEALAFSVQHFGDLLKHNLVDYASHLIGHDNPDLLVELRFMLEHCKLDISVSESVIRFLDTIPSSSQLLLRSLRCIFSMASADLQQIVVLWMESHQLSDLRIETFARVISECRIDVPIDRTLTGQFLSSWCEAERGVGESASQHFGELARTPLPLALEARLLCLQHAAAGTDQSDANRLTEFLLLLQQQLAMLIRRHMECDSVLISSRAVLENDVRIAGEHLLDERQLFTTAGRYAELGGGNIQLDILKIHNDSPPDVTSNAVISVLHFMKAMGVRSSDAVERVLKEYLPSFQAPLPLLPFVEFLSSESIDADETSNVLLLGGASSDDMFDCFLGLLDSAGSPLFPITNLVPVMKKLCTQCSRNDRVRSAYLLECIRGMLAGEYHSLMLSEEEVTFLQKEERAMKLK